MDTSRKRKGKKVYQSYKLEIESTEKKMKSRLNRIKRYYLNQTRAGKKKKN